MFILKPLSINVNHLNDIYTTLDENALTARAKSRRTSTHNPYARRKRDGDQIQDDIRRRRRGDPRREEGADRDREEAAQAERGSRPRPSHRPE